MEIKNSTVYTKERLLKFNHYYAKNQIFIWTALGVGTPIVYLGALFLSIFSELSFPLAMGVLAVTLLDIIIPLMLFVFLPKTMLKKTKSLDATLEYTFSDEDITINASKSDMLDEKTTMKYQMLLKAERNKDELYLFIHPNNALVVDLSTMTDEEKEALKAALKANLKKVKWK